MFSLKSYRFFKLSFLKKIGKDYYNLLKIIELHDNYNYKLFNSSDVWRLSVKSFKLKYNENLLKLQSIHGLE